MNAAMKPVWRMNNGSGVPSDYEKGRLHRLSYGLDVWRSDANYPTAWKLFGNSNDITYYQTNRTKAAKYERVDCDECMGSGNEIDWEDENCLPIDGTICPDCNSKGYTLEKIE